jgi:hypothetical protein
MQKGRVDIVSNLADLARRWSRQTEIDKGIRLDSGDMDLLNALGVGKLILTAVAERQQQQCLKRTLTSIQGGDTGLRGIEGGKPDHRSLKLTLPTNGQPPRFSPAVAGKSCHAGGFRAMIGEG